VTYHRGDHGTVVVTDGGIGPWGGITDVAGCAHCFTETDTYHNQLPSQTRPAAQQQKVCMRAHTSYDMHASILYAATAEAGDELIGGDADRF
jgi:hypothetical protein